MLFQLDEPSQRLQPVSTSWNPEELGLESYIITTAESAERILAESVFGEPLLLVSNQVRTANKKRADILALDRNGNAVIIELKRDRGRLGVETQALQYLADFSAYKGRDFLRRFSSTGLTEEAVLSFLGDKGSVDLLNQRPRVILLARDFDESVFVIGEWLSDKGVAFRCISYQPIEISGARFLSFSVAFDHSPEGLYQLIFSASTREPGVFWHNIADNSQEWWDFLRNNGQIPACFQNAPGDQGEKILCKHKEGDKIIAFAKGYGAIGWGVIENPKYRLITANQNNGFGDKCLHRLNIKWEAVANQLSDGLRVDEVRRRFSIYHPISTSVAIRLQDGLRLIEDLSQRFRRES
jgi:hypothetical protein